LLVVGGCTESHVGDGDGGGLALDSPAPAVDTGSLSDAPPSIDAPPSPDATLLYRPDANRPDANRSDAFGGPLPILCGGVECWDGEICCELDLRCVAPGDPTCTPPSGAPPGACASNADCTGGLSCQWDGASTAVPGQCGGLGRCQRIADGCSGWVPVCGCDGRTYADPCAAYTAGVRVASNAPCGGVLHESPYGCSDDHSCRHGHCDLSRGRCVNDLPLYACGRDTDCPAGSLCCARNGICIAPGDDALCAPPPPDTYVGCETDLQCQRFDGSYWSTLGGDHMFCDAGARVGGCRDAPPNCEGTLASYCACDGMTYQNRCEIRRASQRAAHPGACP
jgi:hypothetical protein